MERRNTRNTRKGACPARPRARRRRCLMEPRISPDSADRAAAAAIIRVIRVIRGSNEKGGRIAAAASFASAFRREASGFRVGGLFLLGEVLTGFLVDHLHGKPGLAAVVEAQ